MSRLFLIGLVLVAACKKESKPKGEVANAKPIEITVDGDSVAKVDPAKAAAYAPLGTFLPADKQDVDTWATIELRTGKGDVSVPHLPTEHPGQVAAFYPGKGGVSLGVFEPADLAKKGTPTWHADDVRSVTMTTAGPKGGKGGQGGGDGEGGGGENEGERPAPSADLKITIKNGDAESVFTGDTLATLPTSHAPIGDTDTPGWTLPQILEAAGVKPTGKVVVQGSEDANLILGPDDFDPAKTTLFIKLNRSGQLRFRVFRKVGDTYEIGGELRGIVRIEVESSSG